MSFVTNDQIMANLHDILQRSQKTVVKEFWTTLINLYSPQAYQVIVNALMRRGWSYATINQWDRGAEFQTDLTIWRCIQQASVLAPQSYSTSALTVTDRRGELLKCALTISGVWQDPDQIYGQAQVGPNCLEDWHDIGPVPGDREDWYRYWGTP